MDRKLTALLLVGIAMLTTGSLKATSPVQDQTAGNDVATRLPESSGRPAGIDRASLTPMHRDILDAVELERASVQALNQRFTQAVSPGEKLAIQQELESVKKAGMLAVLDIQLRYARAEGRTEVVQQLEAAVERVRNPSPMPGSGETLLQKAGSR
jgi:hypothetical protein